MSQNKKNSWSERLRNFVGLGQRVEQSTAHPDSSEQLPVQVTRRPSKAGLFTCAFAFCNNEESMITASVASRGA